MITNTMVIIILDTTIKSFFPFIAIVFSTITIYYCYQNYFFY